MVTTTPTPPSEHIRPVHIEEEMRTSYLNYAMSVIVSPCVARRARRAEAGATPDTVRDARHGHTPRLGSPQERPYRRRGVG